MLRFAPLFVFAALATVLFFSLEQPVSIKQQSFTPSFSLPTIYPEQGSSFSDEYVRGKVTIVHFFASWCISCLAEHGAIMILADKAVGVPMIGITWKDTPDKALAWLNKHGNPYTLVADDAEGKAVIAFGVRGVPETFIVNPKGEVVYHYPGVLTEEIINTEVLPLLKGLSNAD